MKFLNFLTINFYNILINKFIIVAMDNYIFELFSEYSIIKKKKIAVEL